MDVAALAGHLRTLAADFPSPGLAAADAHLEAAQAELKDAARESNAEVGLHRLGTAREKLADARKRLADAAGAVDDYLDSIGAGAAASSSRAAPTGTAPAAPAPVDPKRWWTDQINELCDRSGDADPQNVPPTRLFNDLLRCAADGNADGYHKRLRDAGPGAGVKLPGLAWPLVRTLAAEHLGRTPGGGDVGTLRDRCSAKVRSLVPRAEPDHIAAALASACTLGPPPPQDGEDHAAAARTAAIGPALVAALHRLGKTDRKA
ncbi:hypothetical protein [Glycomyces buryatensis]|uniref:Uncharacterized protein n=1 Tax=Glycomyces buryatensis TaxID=2570927 RepID=A0A4V4HSN8_9ACTN|nr:hypothetical protein [Glycomyces buryatensis]THV42376.1 hypothetical protein FAB82_06905 [Glycomyces buryatensis]